jgi:hypothetical protein
MSDLSKILNASRIAAFIGGAAAAVIAPRVVSSGRVRKAAVYAVAKGMRLQEDAARVFEGIREDAQDVYHEAKERAGKQAAEKNAGNQGPG